MIDAHIHIERGQYTKEWVQQFINQAVKMGLDEIYLLEHSHRFKEFKPMYQSVKEYSDYQKVWLQRKSNLSINEYTSLITEIRQYKFPIQVKWGLEVCYFPESEELISDIINSFDFITGSIHWVDGFGFDHKAELWNGVDVDKLYKRYYELMLQLIDSKLFTGLAHPDSVKCFKCFPSFDLTPIYELLANALRNSNMYAEQSGGLALNYGYPTIGMNDKMLNIFKQRGVIMLTASDAHRPEDVGANISKMAVASMA
ncbi:histidinol phosphate phosphatase HisJ family [Desulfitobacterium dehalogenans ATCC 51507]|uniref:Histidinol-phosphatase n=1 Tax=Desulfitobacterium dehalogenans (strain ATCC 51507 / DSM 9161 / JW/IU-DC1) TaxID=756499 RepID=I4A5S9_DESDJ|nr:histidinol-phosphatase HisJ family protein [Desulfitobacterium dehalogenans]AFL99313.1 histidinol phosphate phosphatase HisJ family [Desulfitobacterium dehalogenans ATCC 51507]